jgi:uncharacterized membrane protein
VRRPLEPVERLIRVVLLAGMSVSVSLMAAGLVLTVARGVGLPRDVVPVADLAPALVALDPAAYLSLGLIVLVATPFVRVAGSLVAFAREGDGRFVAVSAVVLVAMGVSVALGAV